MYVHTLTHTHIRPIRPAYRSHLVGYVFRCLHKYFHRKNSTKQTSISISQIGLAIFCVRLRKSLEKTMCSTTYRLEPDIFVPTYDTSDRESTTKNSQNFKYTYHRLFAIAFAIPRSRANQGTSKIGRIKKAK